VFALRDLGRRSVAVPCAFGVIVATAVTLAGQAGGQTPAGTQTPAAGAQPPGRGAQPPPARGAAPPAAANTRRFVLIGCVSREGAPAAPRYFITDSRFDKPTAYRLEGDATELSFHVGHTIEVTGTLTAAAPAPTGPNASALTMKVEAMTYLRNSCAASK